jgi:hypothetical protein
MAKNIPKMFNNCLFLLFFLNFCSDNGLSEKLPTFYTYYIVLSTKYIIKSPKNK